VTITFCLVVVLAVGVLAYHRASHQVALATLGALAIIAVLFDSVSLWATAPLVLIFAGFAALGYSQLRRAWITRPLLEWFRRSLPALSDTEQAALDAGTVWWDAELFSGKPDWLRLLHAPRPSLSAEEQAFLDGPVEELCALLDEWQIQQDRDLPAGVWAFLKQHRFFGMIIDKAHGGLGFSPLANSSVVMKIATRNVNAAVTVMVPNSLGPGELLQHYGTEAQKAHYLPRLASGEDIPCFALTSQVAGSDAGAMIDTGIVCRGQWQGREVLGFRLTWDKRYITLAPVATLLGLAFKARDPDRLLGSEVELGITCALVPTNLPGVTTGRRHSPSGAAFMNGPTQGRDVFIPLDSIIGGAEQIGQGWAMLVQSLAAGRAISLPALGVAGGKLAAHATGAYARVRKQFKMPIGYFEGVEAVLARLAGNAYRDDATRQLTLTALMLGERPSVLTAIAKSYLTESNRRAINDAMDVHGGKGIMQGPGNYLNSLYQMIPIGITVEGANILTRSMIVFGQGAIRAHPFILREMRAAAKADADHGLAEFDSAFFGHVAFTLSNLVRTLWMGLTGARLVGTPINGPTAHYFRQLTRMSSAFALISDLVLMVLGGKFKFREKISGRLADVLAHLYMASAVLKTYEDAGRPAEDLPLLNWAMRDSLLAIQTSLINVIRNFPVWWLRRPLKTIMFPFGLFYREPSDNLGKRAARVLLTPGPARDRLLSGMYFASQGRGLGELNAAFAAVIASTQAERHLRAITREAVTPGNVETLIATALPGGEFTAAEAELVRRAQQAVARAVAVDDFAPGELTVAAEASSESPGTRPPGSAERVPRVASASTPTSERNDLQQIKGIGPKLEHDLRSLGYERFAQIANLTDAEIKRIEAHIRFNGRIAREDWIGQARILSRGSN
jgi:acyl-CoA dehydrogenase